MNRREVLAGLATAGASSVELSKVWRKEERPTPDVRIWRLEPAGPVERRPSELEPGDRVLLIARDGRPIDGPLTVKGMLEFVTEYATN